LYQLRYCICFYLGWEWRSSCVKGRRFELSI